MKTREEALAEARTEGFDVAGWSEEQCDGYYFSRLPLEVRLQNACPGCGSALVRDQSRLLGFVLGPPRLGRCPACGWQGVKPRYYVAADHPGNDAAGPFATHAEATLEADRVGGYVTSANQRVSWVSGG